jgi:hypothetical protein
MAGITRGFTGRRRERDPRLPPGQYDARDEWPVLHAEATPRLSTDRWTFTIEGLVERVVLARWEPLVALTPSPQEASRGTRRTVPKVGARRIHSAVRDLRSRRSRGRPGVRRGA